MGKLHPTLPAYTIPWLGSQRMFWVATAPLLSSGRVNVSPKCAEGTFHVINEGRVWYEDLTGSGVETIAHLREPDNGRITILFHAFGGPPSIVRIYGKGSAYEFGTPEYDNFLLSVSSADPRQSDLENANESQTCGFSVPFYEFKSYRTKLHEWAERLESHGSDQVLPIPPVTNANRNEKGAIQHLEPAKDGMKSWWYTRNTKSIDGLPGLNGAYDAEGPLISRRHVLNKSENTDGGKMDSGRCTSGGADLFMVGLGVGVGIGALLAKLLLHPRHS